MIIKIINSSIRGYHIFHIRPHFEIPMDVVKETRNEKDASAVKVMMPDLMDIPQSYHKAITWKAKKKTEEDQIVRHIASKQVGRVPANLCTLFENLLEEKCLTSIKW